MTSLKYRWIFEHRKCRIGSVTVKTVSVPRWAPEHRLELTWLKLC